MKHTFGMQAKKAGLALAAVTAFAALGIGTTQAADPAAPPATTPTFTTADISINPVGFIDCSFKESGLGAGAMVNYTCGATDVGWVTQCFVKGNKPVANLPVALHVAHTADGLTTTRTYTATSRGVITQAILTAYPTIEQEVQEPLCPETEGVVITETLTAIRWCNASLVDTTNGITGASEPTLFLQMVRNGSSAVPDCATLATLPSDILGTPIP
jgi:hypothetical protein